MERSHLDNLHRGAALAERKYSTLRDVVDAGAMSSMDDALIRALHAIRLNVMSERGDFGQGIERCNEEIERLLTPDGWRNEHHVRATYCGHGHTYCAGCYDACPYCP